MDRHTAIALATYLQRGVGIIPTTLAEANVLQGALASIQAVANGLVTMEVKPVGAVDPPAPKSKAK